ncbi:hypothetical protein SxD43FB_18625 [Sphingobium sp. D43FB]|nr:hypothetical protein SxD43FB_18625 [Sphingobium sp. D43FB]
MQYPHDSPGAASGAPDAAPARILSLQEAAAFLGIHANTLRGYAKAGVVPGAKFGRDWRFLEADLVASLRARYSGRARMQSSADERQATWHSTSVQAPIMSNAQHLTERQLDALLEPQTGKRRKNITTS